MDTESCGFLVIFTCRLLQLAIAKNLLFYSYIVKVFLAHFSSFKVLGLADFRPAFQLKQMQSVCTPEISRFCIDYLFYLFG